MLLLQRGGWQVYLGPLGTHGSAVVRYLSSLPGMPAYPKGMNPSSWMLDALGNAAPERGARPHQPHPSDGEAAAKAALAAGTGIGAGIAGTSPAIVVLADATVDAVDDAIDAVAFDGAPSQQPPGVAAAATTAADVVAVLPPGDALQARLRSAGVWAVAASAMATHGAPAPGARAVAFASSYPRAFAVQYGVLVRRAWLAYARNVGLNFGRLVALVLLALVFGTTYYSIAAQATTLGGVQSLVAAIFMATAFSALINMNTAVPANIAARAVFYREVAARAYAPVAYGLATITVELPWLAGLVLVSMPMFYFMYGLSPSPQVFFFTYLVTFVLGFVYFSLGVFIATSLPTFEVAQAILGVLGPLFFLFGGLWSPPPQMTAGARWFVWIDPNYCTLRAGRGGEGRGEGEEGRGGEVGLARAHLRRVSLSPATRHARPHPASLQMLSIASSRRTSTARTRPTRLARVY